MNERGRSVLPLIGFIIIVGVLLGGVALAKSFRPSNTGDNTAIQSTTKNGPLGEYTINDTGKISTSGVDKIIISGVSSQINILRHNEDEVEAHFYGNVRGNKDVFPHLQVFKEGNNAVVKIKYPKVLNSSISGQTTLDVTIPEMWGEDVEVTSVSGNIIASELTGKDIALNTVSGEIEVDRISGADVSLNSTSGNFNIGHLQAKGLFKKTTVSGRFEINTLQCDNARLESTSGDNFIGEAEAEKISANSVSGRIEISMQSGSATIGTTSGGVYAQFLKSFESFKASSISGEVKLEIPEDSEFKLDIQTVSGDIQCNDFSMNIISTKRNELKAKVGDGGSQIEVDTTSGSIEIKKR